MRIFDENSRWDTPKNTHFRNGDTPEKSTAKKSRNATDHSPRKTAAKKTNGRTPQENTTRDRTFPPNRPSGKTLLENLRTLAASARKKQHRILDMFSLVNPYFFRSFPSFFDICIQKIDRNNKSRFRHGERTERTGADSMQESCSGIQQKKQHQKRERNTICRLTDHLIPRHRLYHRKSVFNRQIFIIHLLIYLFFVTSGFSSFVRVLRGSRIGETLPPCPDPVRQDPAGFRKAPSVVLTNSKCQAHKYYTQSNKKYISFFMAR
jgi:hypothetical protein